MYRRKGLVYILASFLFVGVACNKTNDTTITTDIKAKMFSDPTLKSSSLDVASKNGIVTLTGTVPDEAARLAARDIASKTPGVKQVIDSINLVSPAPAAEAAPAPPLPAEPTPVPKKLEHKKKPAKPKDTSPSNDDSQAVPATPASAETASAAPPESTPPPTPQPAATPAPPPPLPPPQPVTVSIPEGSIMTIRTIDSIDSANSSAGQTFRASLDAPVVVNDSVVLPRGLNVNLKLVQASSAGKFSGRSELTVSLDSVTYQGKTYTLATSDVQQQGSSRGKRSAAVIGGGAALGALIGGLAGGGKGAAIGAGVGAGGGTAAQAITKGQQVRIPSETRLDFTLHNPVAVTYLPPKKPVQPPTQSADQPPTTNQN
jgi:BON domain